MKKILLPTDFSVNSWAALVYAVKLFDKIECEFYLLHTITMNASSITNFSTDKLNSAKEKAIINLNDLKKEAENSSTTPLHHFEIILSYYYLDDAINYSAEKHQIDFTIIGTKGATNMKELFIGSNTSRVIQNTKYCPTIVVPENYSFDKLNQITILTDLNHPMNKELLSSVNQLASGRNSKISLLHISNKEELNYTESQELNSLKGNLTSYDTYFHLFTNSSNKQNIVNDFIKDTNTDLLVLLNYKKDFLEKIIQKSLITIISQSPKIPMLVLQKK